jgi:hypothetical protein
MGGFAPKGHAKVDPQHPAAFAHCEMCGFQYNNRDLKWEVQWTGNEIRRTGHLVCPKCWDTPNYTIRAKTLPPDPVPIANPRSEGVHKHVRRWPGEPFPQPYEGLPDIPD